MHRPRPGSRSRPSGTHGAAYLSKGDLSRAIADNTTVIQIDPAYATAYYHRGIAYESREQYDQAIADFSKAVEINAGHGGAFDARASTLRSTSACLPRAMRARRVPTDVSTHRALA
jgi:Tfp pilus assembly protein PilF